MPAYNKSKVIEQTIESILNSKYPSFDIIIIDDGSSDETLSIIQNRFSNHPLIRIFTKKNGGKSRALNYGIEQTDAPIIVTLDADT